MCLRRGLLVSLLASLCAIWAPLAGDAWAESENKKPKVTFSWDGRFFMDDLPHGKVFLIELKIPHGMTFKEGLVWSSEDKCEKPGSKARLLPFEKSESESEGESKGPQTITLSAPALKYSTPYCFRFTATEGLSPEQVKKLGDAVESLIRVVSERQLYSSDARADFLSKQMGTLARQTLMVDGKATNVLDWVTDWTEREDGFVRLWQHHGDLERSVGNVVKYADRARGLNLSDANLVYATMPASLAATIKAHGELRKLIEKAALARARTNHIDRTATVALTPAAAAVRDRAHTLREQSNGARRQICGQRAKPSMSLDELTIAIDRLQRETVNLEAQIAVANPDGRKERAALEQKQARLQASKRALAERRTDRLCKNLLNMSSYADRLAEALTEELQVAVEIGRLNRSLRQLIADKKAAIPIEVVNGTRSADPTYTERATAYISADVGTVFPRFSSGNWGASLFVGVNFSFSPVDKDIPLSEDGGFGKRFSIIAGLTITEFRDNAQSVTGVAGGQAALFGVGYRISDYLRLGAGGVLFRQTHPNPAIDSKSLKVAPYVAVSVDSDIAGLIKNLFESSKKNAL